MKFIKNLSFLNKYKVKLNNQHERDIFVVDQIKKIPNDSLLLDAGCGGQYYRKYCSHLNYKSQDFGKYTIDTKQIIGTIGLGGVDGYRYGRLDYTGDIWNIDEKDQTFDAILCTEVFEHIPFPIESLREFSRLLKSGGVLILTAPSNCLRHMDPFFFYTGFSDRWFEKFIAEMGMEIKYISPVGDYFSWLSVEIFRTMRSGNFFTKIILIPAFLYYFYKKKDQVSIDTLCMGYHVVAVKK
ncbi:class I SAM-dependent methyltransferase [Polynucleobacter sp. 86C-FISCH]|uniref:class I SAM-dependent methyltransferase n=1 Tax=Polynucleobacter sp. 86C-FISCH TaxID=2689101 RepID=UPI001C0D3265|nr:class I SAM-dependent methyltransferase [Polynucleobacter sp. 86C-FISCH]MBU3596007.1 class I SAM-dependent methyltransferase [Polynucleobacter sp. 86C-FISCH]